MNLTLLIVLNILFAIVIYVLLNRKMERSIRNQDFLQRVRHELEGIVADIDGSADRNIQLIEERIDQLRRLLTQVDEQLKRLRAQTKTAIARMPSPQATPAQPDQTITPPTPQKDNAPQQNESSGDDIVPIPMRQRVLTLYRDGLDPPAIASRLGTAVGEVELILSLENRLHK